MVKPNQKVFSPYYVTPSCYQNWSSHLQELAKYMKTDITFNFKDQYFEIEGRSQSACEDTMMKIITKMLPELCKNIDEKMMSGTYEDLEAVSETPSPILSRASSTSSSAVGRALKLDDTEEKEIVKKTEPYYYNETESDDDEEDEEEFTESFIFAKNVRNPMEILSIPSIGGKQPVDYLAVIGRDTDTECSLIGRNVNIVGTNESSVKEALQRFKNLQTIHKRSKKPLNIVSCIHIPSETEFGLYFCHLDRYAHKDYVDILSMKDAPYFVLLPVLKDGRGSYQKPKDLLDTAAPSLPLYPNQSPKIQQESIASLEERMRQATFKNQFSNIQHGLAPDQRPLWGENKGYVTNPSMQKPASSTPRQSAAPSVPQTPKSPVDDFPALPTTPRKQPAKKGGTRGVIRIKPQKSSPAMLNMESHTEMLRNYNSHIVRTSLAEGLESVRGFNGSIKLSASMGKVLWTRLQPETQKKIWTYQQVNDILMKGHGVHPLFNGITTENKDVISKIAEMCPSHHSLVADFEIHARARIQPILPYKNVVLHMSQNAVEFRKIVVASHKITEVNWVSLDRKYDFQINLQTEELTRTDVKPYSTFLKKISISPHTRQMTYEDVPDFLTVDAIYLKNTAKIRLHFPFVVEITRVEKLPLINQTSLGYNINKVLGDTGNGKVWYTVELFYSAHDEDFKRNNNLPAGKFASWTVDDILGAAEDPDGPLIQLIRCLLTFTDKAEGVV